MDEQVQDMRLQFERNMAESHLRDGLALLLNGKTEVRLDCGIADIVTETHVYEVKNIRYWKHAVGQSIVYASELNLCPGIALFGWFTTDRIVDLIGKKCQEIGIDVFYYFFEEPNDIFSTTLAGLGLEYFPIPDGLPDMSFEVIKRQWRVQPS